MRQLFFYLNAIVTGVALLFTIFGYLMNVEAGFQSLILLGAYQVVASFVNTIYASIVDKKLFALYIIYWFLVLLFFKFMIHSFFLFCIFIALYNLYVTFCSFSNSKFNILKSWTSSSPTGLSF